MGPPSRGGSCHGMLPAPEYLRRSSGEAFKGSGRTLNIYARHIRWAPGIRSAVLVRRVFPAFLVRALA
eukprot:scaffold6545_cov323-Prasinococcus_capsulatus_cf.AAC.2